MRWMQRGPWSWREGHQLNSKMATLITKSFLGSANGRRFLTSENTWLLYGRRTRQGQGHRAMEVQEAASRLWRVRA